MRTQGQADEMGRGEEVKVPYRCVHCSLLVTRDLHDKTKCPECGGGWFISEEMSELDMRRELWDRLKERAPIQMRIDFLMEQLREIRWKRTSIVWKVIYTLFPFLF